MTPGRRRTLAMMVAGATTFAIQRKAPAAGFPDRPVRLILPYPAGGGADQWARIVTGRLEKVLGQSVVYDYRPGGASAIGAEAAARAPADGYTFHLISTGAFAQVPHLRKVSYDPISSFVPLAYLGVLPMLLVVNPSVPARNLQEFVAHAKAHPGQINCASAGMGSSHHLIAEAFKARAGIAMNHVPYKGAAQYMPDLMGGQVHAAVSTIPPALQQIQSGRIRALAVSTARRSSTLPDVPSIAEQGYPGFDEKTWNCFVGPAGIPAEPLERMRSALKVVLQETDVVAALNKAGVEDVNSVPVGQITALMRAEFDKWGEVIRNARIPVTP